MFCLPPSLETWAQQMLVSSVELVCWEVQCESNWRNTKTKHTQAEWGSMTEWHDPHKISVKDTNNSWLWLYVCNLFEFYWCKGFVLPPHGSFIVVRSYSQLILRLESLRNVLPKMYNFYARFYWIEMCRSHCIAWFPAVCKTLDNASLFAIAPLFVCTFHFWFSRWCKTCSFLASNLLHSYKGSKLHPSLVSMAPPLYYQLCHFNICKYWP